jgi:hypothetical protein
MTMALPAPTRRSQRSHGGLRTEASRRRFPQHYAVTATARSSAPERSRKRRRQCASALQIVQCDAGRASSEAGSRPRVSPPVTTSAVLGESSPVTPRPPADVCGAARQRLRLPATPSASKEPVAESACAADTTNRSRSCGLRQARRPDGSWSSTSPFGSPTARHARACSGSVARRASILRARFAPTSPFSPPTPNFSRRRRSTAVSRVSAELAA